MKKTKPLLSFLLIEALTEGGRRHAKCKLDYLGVTSPWYLESKRMKRKENSITSIVLTGKLPTPVWLNAVLLSVR